MKLEKPLLIQDNPFPCSKALVVSLFVFAANGLIAQSLNVKADQSASQKSDQSIPVGPRPEVVVLSPFLVNEEIDRGYEAANTLSGTRLNTPAKFVGSAVTDITPALMQDLGLYNVMDVIDYTPNSSAYFGGGISDNSNSIFGTNFGYVRGISIGSNSRDFIKDRAPDDAYNADRISFTRGPNAILFGVGDPAGVINTVGTRAQMKDANQTGLSIDNWGSHRETIKINKEVVKGKMALYIAGLDENRQTNRKPSDRISDRLTGSITIKPFSGTTLRVTGEDGRLHWLNVRPWAGYGDALSVWQNRGSQEVPAALANGGVQFATIPTAQLPSNVAAQRATLLAQANAAGFSLLTTAANPNPIIVHNSLGSGAPLVINGNGFLTTTIATAGVGNVSDPTLVNSPVPYRANPTGYGNAYYNNFKTYTFTIEQAIGKNLFIEATFNRQNNNLRSDFSAGAYDSLYIDKNRTVLTIANGQNAIVPNPNYNRYFMAVSPQGNWSAYHQTYDDHTGRVSAAYQLNLSERAGRFLGSILGHHNFAAVRERQQTGFIQDLATEGLRNTSSQAFASLPGASTGVNKGQNVSGFITYVDPNTPSTWAQPGSLFTYPWGGFDGSTFPPADPSGFTPQWIVIASTRLLQITNSQSFVMQNFFWNDRIVPTFGWRRDVVDFRSIPSYTNPVTALVESVSSVNPYNGSTLNPMTYVEHAGETKTQGVVVYPVRWLGFSYNQSQNFNPTTTVSRDIFGNVVAPTRGKGKDYGFKFSVWDGKVTGSLTRFNTSQVAASGNALQVAPVTLLVPMLAITQTMSGLTNNAVFQNYPWHPSNQGTFAFVDLSDVNSTGYEFVLTANPTRNWRVSLSASRAEAISSNYGALEKEWLTYARNFITTNYPQYLSAVTASSGLQQSTPETVQQQLDDVGTYLNLAHSLDGRRNARQALYTGVLVTAYDFVTGPLKHFGIGATYRYRSKVAIGYAYQAGSKSLFNPDMPYFGPNQNPIGLFVNYRFIFLEKIHARLQLNGNNLNMDQKLHPFTKVDSGNGTPVVARYYFGPGKSVAFSTIFDF